jgi:hypothetical protein
VFAEKFGVVVDVKEIQETLKLLEPKNNHNIEGQLIYFPRLYEKQMDDREEGEIDDISLVPLNEELNLLSGDWMKEKQNPTKKVRKKLIKQIILMQKMKKFLPRWPPLKERRSPSPRKR